ncbi:hypothetical protein HYPSUDRAFT_133934 [Hypholoma sublateritium FD-334 SS-4]|uniref:Tc1-like transposase DDE domain-containing protein n=1 Tax=Hypholoma sublateritium (strain FD-334 SS-4) TaxID=945553 RepID=A0A0D2MPN4_HYPSF|nr:hypothetical protein HYPSUDRAFT_133934 [Hypholoma sublateritium FD-334 SS-4]
MVNRRISPDLKVTALRLWELGWDVELITESLSISRASIYRWRQIFEETQSVNRPPSAPMGRPRAIIRAVMTAIVEVYNNKADAYLDELVWWLAVHHDLPISRSALQKNLVSVGLTHKLLHKIARERDEEVRAEFRAVIHEHSNGEHADFVDNFVRGERYSMVAAITVEGYVSTRVIPGSFNAAEFYDYVVEQILPDTNPYPGNRSILIMDNCRIHHNLELLDMVNTAGA